MEAERRVATVEAAKEQHVQTLKQMVFQIRCMQSRASEVMASLDELNGTAVRKLVEKEVLPVELFGRLLEALDITDADLVIPKSVGVRVRKFDVAAVKSTLIAEILQLASQHERALRRLLGVVAKVTPVDRDEVLQFIGSTKGKWESVELKMGSFRRLSSVRTR